MVKSGVTTLQFLWLLFFFYSHSFAAVNANIDRNTIHLNESLQLTIEATDGEEGEPDTALLEKNFEILSRNHSSSISIINGSMSRKSVWNLVLMPRASGTFTIPAFKIDRSISRPITVEVTNPSASMTSSAKDDLWIEMKATPEKVYVQQQLTLVIRVYQRITLNQAKMNEPEPANTIIERLGEDRTYQTTLNGQNWHVTERRYALFPQKSGQLNIEPVQLDGSIMTRNNRAFFQSTRPIRVRSNALSLQVEAVPANRPGGDWLPAKNITILESWPTGIHKVGEPITRTLTLKADGLASSQLPQFDALLPDGLKIYPDKPRLNDTKQADGIHSSRVEKVAIIPVEPGTYILPGIEISWWNTTRNIAEKATLPPRSFQVIAASGAAAAGSNQQNSMTAIPTPPLTQAVNTNRAAEDQRWRWLAIFSILGWLITLIWIWRSRSTITRSASSHKTGEPQQVRKLKRNVAKACALDKHPQQAKACEQAVLAFARYQWPEESVHNLTRVAELCDDQLAEQIKQLEAQLYGRAVESWSATAFAAAFDAATWQKSKKKNTDSVALPPLYSDM